MLGIEPAANIAELRRGRPDADAFFTRDLAQKLVRRPERRRLYATGVLAVPDRTASSRASAMCSTTTRRWIEVPYGGHARRRVRHDLPRAPTYFAGARSPPKYGLGIPDVERVPIHGGSLRVFARRGRDGRKDAGAPRRGAGLGWQARRRIERSPSASGASRERLRNLLHDLRAGGTASLRTALRRRARRC